MLLSGSLILRKKLPNQNGTPAANTLKFSPSWANDFVVVKNKLIIADLANHRVLIFEDIIKNPQINLNNSPEAKENGRFRLSGRVEEDNLYNVTTVEYSVNGNSFTQAIAQDGAFDEQSEDYYFDFDPAANQPKDSYGDLIPGYTIRVRSFNSNFDNTDRLFYFSPFDVHAPENNLTVSSPYPTFEFSVNKQNAVLHDALEKYQIKVKYGDNNNSGVWETLIDNIPINFRSVKSERRNMQWQMWGDKDTDNGVYETVDIYAEYSDDSSRVKVYSKKTPLSGTYQWKVVAVDKSGNNQETGVRTLYVNADKGAFVTDGYPLAILNITGYGNPLLNSYDFLKVKDNYSVSTPTPEIYGIAWVGSTVKCKLTDINCIDQEGSSNCSKTYTTTANVESRFGINIPKGDLEFGKTYSANFSAALGEKYTELPQIKLSIGSNLPVRENLKTEENKDISNDETNETETKIILTPTSRPVVQRENPASDEKKKRCIWFICW